MKRKFKANDGVQLKKPAVIAAFKATCSVTRACEISGVSRQAHYDWLKSDPAYLEAFEASKDEAAQVLEDEAVRRAEGGVEEPVFYKGSICGTVRKYSDTLLMFLLNGARPTKYRQNSKIEMSGEVRSVTTLDLTKLSAEEARGFLSLLRKAGTATQKRGQVETAGALLLPPPDSEGRKCS